MADQGLRSSWNPVGCSTVLHIEQLLMASSGVRRPSFKPHLCHKSTVRFGQVTSPLCFFSFKKRGDGSSGSQACQEVYYDVRLHITEENILTVVYISLMASSPDVEALLPTVLRDSCIFCLIILSFIASMVQNCCSSSSHHISILVSRKEVGKRGTSS